MCLSCSKEIKNKSAKPVCKIKMYNCQTVSPFLPNAPFLYPLKTSENRQNYYEMAIRQNNKTAQEMRKAIGAVLYHWSESSSGETRHL